MCEYVASVHVPFPMRYPADSCTVMMHMACGRSKGDSKRSINPNNVTSPEGVTKNSNGY